MCCEVTVRLSFVMNNQHCLIAGLLLGMITANLNEIQHVILCNNGEYKHLNCSTDTYITVHELKMNHQGICDSWNSECADSLTGHIQKECSMDASCDVAFVADNCIHYLPRKIHIFFSCLGPWWMFGTFDYDDSKWICTASLSELHCNRGFKIKIEDINFQTGVCTDCEERLILRDLRELCNDRRKCTAASDKKHPCLYRIQYALLSFYCTDNSISPPTFPSIDEDYSTTTSNLLSTSIGHGNEEPTLPIPDFPDAPPKVNITIDVSGRVLLTFQSNNSQPVALCADGWNDNGANVVCGYLFGNKTAKAREVDNDPNLNYAILPSVLNCTGSESSLIECDGINVNCSSLMVAGVECCGEYGCQTESSSSQIKSEKGGSSVVGIGVGVSVAVVVIVALIAFLYIRRRVFTKSKETRARSHIGNQSEDYTGQQGIGLPSVSRNGTPDKYNVQYTNCPGFETNQNNEQSSRSQLYSIASKTSEYNQSTYAASQDGVYDIAHDRRHVENEANTYGHSVDEMYDTSNRQLRYDKEGDSYGRVVDTVYDASDNNGRQTANIDNKYARAVDTVYDTAGQIGTIGVRDDMYN